MNKNIKYMRNIGVIILLIIIIISIIMIDSDFAKYSCLICVVLFGFTFSFISVNWIIKK